MADAEDGPDPQPEFTTGDLDDALRDEGVWIGSPDRRADLAEALVAAEVTPADVAAVADYCRASTKRDGEEGEFAHVRLLAWLLRDENREKALRDLRAFRAAQARKGASGGKRENAPPLKNPWRASANFELHAYYRHTFEQQTPEEIAEDTGSTAEQVKEAIDRVAAAWADDDEPTTPTKEDR